MRSVRVRSEQRDVTAKVAIRDAALRLFADEGFDAVTVRQVASSADVSPALVLHHFGSKAGLRAAVDAHVIDHVNALIVVPEPDEVVDTLTGANDGGVQRVLEHLPADSPVLPYLRRMLLTDDESARALVRSWHAMSVELMIAWRDAGIIDPGPDPQVRAALLLSMDLAVILMRETLGDLIGDDPMSRAGMARWAADAYRLSSLMLRPGVAGPEASRPRHTTPDPTPDRPSADDVPIEGQI